MDPEVIVAPATEAVVADPAPATTEPTAEPAESAPAPAPVADDQGTIEDPQGAKPSKVVSELIAQRKKRQDAEREAAYWKGMAEGRGKQETPTPVQPTPSTAAPVAPKLDQFETYEQYESAKDEYLVQLAEHRVTARYLESQQRQQAADGRSDVPEEDRRGGEGRSVACRCDARSYVAHQRPHDSCSEGIGECAEVASVVGPEPGRGETHCVSVSDASRSGDGHPRSEDQFRTQAGAGKSRLCRARAGENRNSYVRRHGGRGKSSDGRVSQPHGPRRCWAGGGNNF